MKKIRITVCFWAILSLCFAAAAVGTVAYCRDAEPVLLEAPEEASLQTEKLMKAVCDGDFTAAKALLYGVPTVGTDPVSADSVGAMIWDAYVQSLDYELMGGLYATDAGLAQKVKFIHMELDTVTAQLGHRARTLLNETVAAAEDVAELYDENNQYREELVMGILQEAARQALEEDVRYTYRVFPVHLVYEDGQWLIAPDREFWNAVSGGISDSSAVPDSFGMYMTNVTSDALEGILAIDKVYWLHDEDTVAPKPNPENYGETDEPRAMEPVLEQAAKLLKGQELIFKTDTQLREDSKINYYLDETILSITWQHMDGKAVYTCSEVVIAHPSQFRRFVSDGTFGSGKLYKATEMAAGVNAVTASNGDYYGYRGYGNLVYNGAVKMAENRYLDTCYVDQNGDLIMLDFNTIYKMEDVQAFVEENGIRFSLAFGPILVEDGEVVAKHYYALGETERPYSRAALCQIGPLHYMLVTVNRKGRDVTQFAKHLQEMGVPRAYALDGGQTSTIVTGNKLMNPVDYGGERETSDIIYFATAVPDGG